MSRWRDLPDELDPRVRAFVEQLRRVVEHAGLDPTAVAEATGYGRTFWERCLDGRLFPPESAVVALAETAGTSPVALTTLWESAERARNPTGPGQDGAPDRVGEGGARPRTRRGGGPAPAPHAPGTAGMRPAPGRFGPPAGRGGAGALGGEAGAAGPAGGPPDPPSAPGPARSPRAGAGRQRLALFLAGAVGVVLVVVGAFWVTGGGRARQAVATVASPSPSAAAGTALPSGVLCGGSACTGRDAEEMGCGGGLATTVKSATVGTVRVEVRYSRTCAAAWGRITQAAPGDVVRVTVGAARRTGTLTRPGGTIAYTPMIAVDDATRATACAVLASGEQGCTR